MLGCVFDEHHLFHSKPLGGERSFRFLWMLLLVLAFTPAHASQTVKIGVLAFRPKLLAQTQWQPLARVLKQAMPEYDFVVEAFTLPEIKSAVENHQLDFILTNPGHYIILAKRYGLSSPLATVLFHERGQPCSVFGGVIFSRTSESTINSLADIQNRTIAIADTESLGGYQMQAYEMKQSGLTIPQTTKLLFTGMPQDKVVMAVLDGRSDVGFLRTGVLEALVSEGKLDMASIKIINRQHPPGFPVITSTRLYPEWPFAALPHVNDNLARHVAATLFLLKDDSAVSKAMGIHGFTVPEDYMPVAEVLRELRMPPFEAAPQFTILDVFYKYNRQFILAFILSAILLLLLLRLIRLRRKLDEAYGLVVRQQDEMQQLAFYDTLTQLPNRRLLSDRLEQTMVASQRNGKYCALMFLDLDNFKPLNDQYGHSAGDLLLIEVASRIKSCVRQTDTTARFGGDEFVVVLSELESDKAESCKQAGIIAEKIRSSLSQPFVLTKRQGAAAESIIEHQCTSSIGVVVFINHEASQEDVIKWADMTMYQAKQDGRNLIRFMTLT